MSVYASFDKTTGIITFTNPVIVGGTASFQGRTSDSVATPSYSWSNNTSTGLYLPVDNMIGVVTAGVERMRIANDGNIGMGTTAPRGILDITGTSQSVVVSAAGNVGIGTTLPQLGMSLHTIGFSLVQPPVAVFEEQYSGVYMWCNGTTGTTAPTTGSFGWNKRPLNTQQIPASLSSIFSFNTTNNTFTLGPGVYFVYAEAPGISCGRHKIAILPNASASPIASDLHGTSEISNAISASTIVSAVNANDATVLNSTKSIISNLLTVTTSTAYKLMHYIARNDAVGAFGIPSNSGVDVYARVVVTKYR